MIQQAGEQSPMGLHLERLIDEVQGKGAFAKMDWTAGLTLERLRPGDPFLRIQGTDISLMMSERGWLTGSSARYHAELGEFRGQYAVPMRGNRWEQAKIWRLNRQKASTPRTYKEAVDFKVAGEDLGFQPLFAWSKSNRFQSAYRATDRTLFQLAERFNKSLLGPIGVGLDVGEFTPSLICRPNTKSPRAGAPRLFSFARSEGFSTGIRAQRKNRGLVLVSLREEEGDAKLENMRFYWGF